MTSGLALFAIVWGVIVALANPPLIAGVLLVAVPVIVLGLVFRSAL